MVRAEIILKVGVVGLVASMSGFGCGGSEVVNPSAPSASRLRTIVVAYAKATDELDHPPGSKEELLPYLKSQPDPDDSDTPVKEIDVDALFRSPTDGENYVIFWGVDCREFSGFPRTQPVLAYEKEGKDGKRVVAQGRYVRTVTDDEFAELPFPKGRRAP